MPEEHRSRMLHVLDELGVPVPAARLDAALTLDRADSADAVRLFYAGSYAASRARWQVLRSVAGAAAGPRAASPRDGEFVRSRLHRGGAAGTRRIRAVAPRAARRTPCGLLERSQPPGRRRLAAGDRQYPPPLVAWPAAHGDGAATGGAPVLRDLDRRPRFPPTTSAAGSTSSSGRSNGHVRRMRSSSARGSRPTPCSSR